MITEGSELIIERVVIENYRLIKRADFPVNHDMNIFVGDNDSGKSTLLDYRALWSCKFGLFFVQNCAKTSNYSEFIIFRFMLRIFNTFP